MEAALVKRKSNLGQHRWDLVWLFLTAIFLRAAFLWAAVGQVRASNFLNICPDTTKYVEAATALASGTSGYESAFVIFGPGFPLLLSLFFKLFGPNPFPFLFAQIILSGLSTLLVYRIGIRLTGRRAVALIAGILSVFSITSICLSCVILSDSVFLFLILLSLELFLGGLDSSRLWRFVVSSLLLSAAILIRSIGQFLPLVFILIAIGYLWGRKRTAGSIEVPVRRRVLQIGVCLIMVAAVQTAWVVRNYHVNGIAAPAFSSAGGPANVAALTLEKITGKPYREIESSWAMEYVRKHGLSELTYAEHYGLLRDSAAAVFRQYPGQMAATYLGLVWENLNDIDYIHRAILPKFDRTTIPWEGILKNNNLNLIPFILAVAGLIILVWRGNYRAAFILGILYLHFALLVGFTKWQGSRLFLPAQCAWPILIASFLVAAGDWIVRVGRWLKERIQGNAVFARIRSDSRWAFWIYVISVAVGLTILFREFIFSSSMLHSDDILGAGLANRRLIAEHFASGGWFPKWNPFVKCGVPFIEAIHGGVFYPLSFVDYIGYIPRMIGFNFLLHFLLSGAFTYLAARQLRLSQIAAMIAGTAYAFSPLMISWVAPGHDGKIYSAALFPLIVFFLDRLLERGRIADVVALGTIFGITILTPHLQMSYYTGLFIGTYAIYRLLRLLINRESAWLVIRRFAGVAMAVALALMISAVQWYPSLNYITEDSPRSYTQRGLHYASAFSLHAEEAISIPLPEFCGLDRQPEERTYWGRNSFKDNSESLGVVTFLLAMLGLLWAGTRDRFWWGAVAGVVLIYALGSSTPVLGLLITWVPLFDSMRAPSTAMYIFAFAGAILAGGAVNGLLSEELNQRRKDRWLRWTLIAVPTLLFVLAVLVTLKGRGFLTYYAQLFYPSLLEQTDFGEVRWERALANLPYLKAGVWWTWLMASLAAVAILLYIKDCRRRAILIGLALLIVAANGRFCSRTIRELDAHQVYDFGPVANFLTSNAGYSRVVGFALSQNKYHIGWYPIQSTIGYHGKEPVWYYRIHGEGSSGNYFRSRFANLTGTRFVVFPSAAKNTLNIDTLGPIPLDTAARFDDCIVFENRNAFPRVYLVDSFQVFDSLRLIHVEAVLGKTNLRRVALLEEKPSLPLERTADTSAAAEIVSYDADSVVVSVATSTNRLLILTDNWFDAWHVYVNGVEKKIYRAYGSFRAVEVPAGSTQVVFKYRSTYVFWGGILSLIGIAVAPPQYRLLQSRASGGAWPPANKNRLVKRRFRCRFTCCRSVQVRPQ